MPQMLLPFFPEEITLINELIGFVKKGDYVYYFNGQMPIYLHSADDYQSFKMYVSQLYIGGNVTQAEIVRAFGISSSGLKRWVKKYREEGAGGFFKKERSRSSPVLTPERLIEIQELLDEGEDVDAISEKTGVKKNTLLKAIRQKRLHRVKKKIPDEYVESKSDRIVIDSKSGMGRACTRSLDRVLASRGLLEEAETRFQKLKDVPLGGVLLALPALLENGLLRHLTKYFNFTKGFYGIRHLFLTIAFMALLRLKSPENLRNAAPGELGKLIGLDRVPEVKTLRRKLEYLSSQNQASEWSSELSKDWMEAVPEAAGTLYIDGHIKPYYGKLTKLPRRYLSRQRLCLSGISDFWVNDLLGLPFFVVRKAENKGLLAVLKDDIVPRLMQDVPNQPGAEEFETNPYLSRFMLVFDREGYSPAFFKRMWEKRIACCTYRKYVKDKWDLEEFHKVNVKLSNGEIEEMNLAERGTFLSGKIWVREIRKLTKSGHQTSIITTDFLSETGPLAMKMFSRWCQENFFKYMMKHYGIDRLIEYETEELDDTVRVVNPEYRKLVSQIKSIAGKLCRRRAKFYEMKTDYSMPEKKRLQIEKERAELLEEIELFEKDLTELKNKRKMTKRHITIGDLPASEKFKSLAKEKKLIVDTIKMIAYRAETAMVGIIRQYMSKKDDARALIRQVFTTEIDIKPDKENKILEISLHNLTNESSDKIIQKLCQEINNTETIFPGTDLRLVAKLVSSQNP